MSQVLTMNPLLGDVLKREFDPNYNRELVTLVSGVSYKVGDVLGKVNASGNYALSLASATSGLEGAELACAVLLESVDATHEQAQALAVVRGPVIVSDTKLNFDSSVDNQDKRNIKHQQLAAFGLVVAHTA
jgi:hypothetical protein